MGAQDASTFLSKKCARDIFVIRCCTGCWKSVCIVFCAAYKHAMGSVIGGNALNWRLPTQFCRDCRHVFMNRERRIQLGRICSCCSPRAVPCQGCLAAGVAFLVTALPHSCPLSHRLKEWEAWPALWREGRRRLCCTYGFSSQRFDLHNRVVFFVLIEARSCFQLISGKVICSSALVPGKPPVC